MVISHGTHYYSLFTNQTFVLKTFVNCGSINPCNYKSSPQIKPSFENDVQCCIANNLLHTYYIVYKAFTNINALNNTLVCMHK